MKNFFFNEKNETFSMKRYNLFSLSITATKRSNVLQWSMR